MATLAARGAATESHGHAGRTLNLTLKVWRQASPTAVGKMVTYEATGISTDMSFLEMLDVVNEGLIARGEEPIAFDSDCREGICGTCGFMINGIAHGPEEGTTVASIARGTLSSASSSSSHAPV